ncbi:hypothetical protein [Salipiger thiooxidans]|uniref:hypothetical protein n=1 Tax=Salipiger thiooxidans TaxID=282683 RepID=UPI001CD75F01|nr:hypothetical protein [Salipiger thiooxidans]MCA0848105.1 hypothetical protein [Salipiger thiooxidans]
MKPLPTKTALSWTSYSVSKRSKQPLLDFILDALKDHGCTILRHSNAQSAPFFISYETPSGTRRSLLAYAFYANSKITTNRPEDEHRFQIKYGSDLKTSLDIAIQPEAVITTIMLGINPEQGYFVAVDPLVNTPAPMSRSVEFKDRNVAHVLSEGWSTWERDRHAPKAEGRPAFDPSALDVRTEVLIGGTRKHLYDLITLEQIAFGLEPGQRHLAADKLHKELQGAKAQVQDQTQRHQLLDELGISDEALFDLIEDAGRLKMAVRGWVAEHHLERFLQSIPGITECERLNEEGKPDISLRWKGSAPILIECKNTLRDTYADGTPRVDFQRTRAAKGNPCSRYYQPGDFPILAACLHPVRESWDFEFALTRQLPAHNKCADRINSNVRVKAPCFTADIGKVLDAHVAGILLAP